MTEFLDDVSPPERFLAVPAGAIQRQRAYCTICGIHGWFNSFASVDFPCKRNDFICESCGSIGRNRHIAITILEKFKDQVQAASLKEFAEKFEGSIYITCVKEAVFRALKNKSGLVSSEYIDGLKSGETKNGILCQDIQNTTFPNECFDLVITEDVLEHVPDPRAAFIEIKRILKPGGFHIYTIPVSWDQKESFPRAIIQDGNIIHLEDPEYHGDPFRPEGILAYTTYGQDVLEKFCNLIGPSYILSAHTDRLYERAFAIYNNWVFVSMKRPA